MKTQLEKGIIIVSLGWHKIVQETGGLNNRHSCFYSSRGWKSDQGASMVSSVESSLSGLQTATFLLCSHMVERERQQALWSLFIRALIPS